LVALFAPAGRQDSVVGDLLEEYREVQLPRFGHAAANRWFGRHALGFLWRIALPWAIAFALTNAARDVLDALVPTDDFHFRSVVSTNLGLATYATAGLVTGWRCGRIVAGTAVSIVMTAMSTAMYLVVALAVSGLISARVLHTGGLFDTFDIPLIGWLFLGVPASCVGAAIGKAARSVSRLDLKGRT
jgi:hypothetical protein